MTYLSGMPRTAQPVELSTDERRSFIKERNELKVKVEWQFSISQAREKLSRHYENVKSKNYNYSALVS
jgi:hypothetical protein